MKNIVFSKENMRDIYCDVYSYTENAKANLIICPGFAEFKNWGFFPFSGRYLAKEFNVYIINFSHNGVEYNDSEITNMKSFAENTYSLEIEDLRFVIDNIKRSTNDVGAHEKESSVPFFLIGHSRGATINFLYNLEYPDEVSGIISWNGLTFVDTLSNRAKEDINTNGYVLIENPRTHQKLPIGKSLLDDIYINKSRYDIESRISENTTPVLLIQATNDFSILIQKAKEISNSNTHIQMIEIPNADHVFNCTHPLENQTIELIQVLEYTKNFIGQNL